MNFKIVKSEIAFRGRVFDVQVDQIQYDSGNPGIRETALHLGGAVVVPVTPSGKIAMVRQYRYPLKKQLLELPAGKLFPNEDPQECAIRELEEETGYKAGKVTKLTAIATTPGFCSEILHIYLAEDLTPGPHNREEGEYGMETVELSLEEIEQKILAQEIYDGKTLSGILLYKLHSKK
jgi:ADP-ribose pyrophosphatase